MGFRMVLEAQEDFAVVGEASNGAEGVALAEALQPDVILMDVRMPVMDGVAATGEVRKPLPSCQVLMLTTFDDEEYIVNALKAGACGYLLKDLPAQDLAKAVISAHNGIFQFDPAVAGKMVAALTRADRQDRSAAPAVSAPGGESALQTDLTEREVEVLRLIARGTTNREIAKMLVISEGTVKNHISNILSRLGLRDRTQAAIYARDHGLL
jgi:DNA-binding NarL/FixJ family response regulator